MGEVVNMGKAMYRQLAKQFCDHYEEDEVTAALWLEERFDHFGLTESSYDNIRPYITEELISRGWTFEEGKQ